MIKYFTYLLSFVLTNCIWTQLNHSSSGTKYFQTNSSTNPNQFPITFDYPFLNNNFSVLIGIISFQKPAVNNSYFYYSSQNKAQTSITIKSQCNYGESRRSTIRYFTFYQNQLFIIKQISKNTPSSFSEAISQITTEYIGIIFLTGVRFVFQYWTSNQVPMKLNLKIRSIQSDSCDFKFQTNLQIYVQNIKFSVLFFKKLQVQQKSKYFIQWGWINVDTTQINQRSNSIRNPNISKLFGINSLFMNNGAECGFNITQDLRIFWQPSSSSSFPSRPLIPPLVPVAPSVFLILSTISSTQISYTDCSPQTNLGDTNYSYINIGTNCNISCINESNNDWKLCDKKYLNLAYFDPCHCPNPPQNIIQSNIIYYCWKTCLQIPYIKQQSPGKCKCIDKLSICNISIQNCNETRCYFSNQDGNITIRILDKNKTQNIIYFEGDVNISPSQYIIDANLTQIISFPQMELYYSIGWQLIDNKTIIGNITYTKDVHFINITSNLTFSLFNHTQFGYDLFQFSRNLSFNQQIIPANGLLAYYYSQSIYNQINYIKYIIYTIFVIVVINIILGFINKYNIVCIQMIGIIQLSYYALPLAGSFRSPLISSMDELKYINGYNLILNSNQNIPFNLGHSGLYLSPFQNVNAMLGLLGVPLVLCAFLFIISLIHTLQKSVYRVKCVYMLGQYMYLCIIYLTIPISFSLGLFIPNISKTQDKVLFLSSCIQISSFFVLLLILSVLYVKTNYSLFGQFKYLFKSNIFSSNYYYLIPVIQRVIIGLCLGFLNASFIPAVIGMVLCLVSGIIVLIKKPYAEIYSNQRVGVNKLLCMSILGVYIFLNFKQQTPSQVALYSPYIILLLNIFSIIVSLSFTIKRTVNNIHQYQQNTKYLNQQKLISQFKESSVNQQLLKTLQQGMHNRSLQASSKMIYKKIVKKKRKHRKISLFEFNDQNQNTNHGSMNRSQYQSSAISQLTPDRIRMVDQMLRRGEI